MDDFERLTNEMNLAYELLENLIRELPITIARQDTLSDYARQLMDASYRAGKADKRVL